MPFSLAEHPARLFGTAFVVFVSLTFVIAVGPAKGMDAEAQTDPGARHLSAAAERGRGVYVREGCAYCHTQQVRPLDIDSKLGRPSNASDYADGRRLSWYAGTPSTLGSQRTGPDLSDVGSRQVSADWHLIHLFNPRAVVAASVMPAFPWLFGVAQQPTPTDRSVTVQPPHAPAQGTVVASQDALDLIEYLLALKQPLPAADAAAGDVDGAALFTSNCSACHQATGTGVAGTFPPLAGSLVVNADDPTEHIEAVLHGVHGKVIGGVAYSIEMPPFGSLLNDVQVAALLNHERRSWGNHGRSVSADQVRAVRQRSVKP
jgi:cytochrome c oxidase cbb3-type subunit 2